MKRALDLVVAIPLLVVLAPLMAMLALAVRATSEGPALHRAIRVGKDGRPFVLLKLRSMRARPGPRITATGDGRITRIGGLLRRWRIDEWPQLWNVVRGDMSLVGPRPEDPRFTEHYTAEQRTILRLRPGITGPAQLAFHDEARLLDPADPEGSYLRDVLPHKLAMDLAYAQTRSLIGDLAILAKTASLALRRRSNGQGTRPRE